MCCDVAIYIIAIPCIAVARGHRVVLPSSVFGPQTSVGEVSDRQMDGAVEDRVGFSGCGHAVKLCDLSVFI